MLFSCPSPGRGNNRQSAAASAKRRRLVGLAFDVIAQLPRLRSQNLGRAPACRPAPLPSQLRGKTLAAGLYCRHRRGAKPKPSRTFGGRLPMPAAQDKSRRSVWRRPLFLVPFGLFLTLVLGLAALIVAPPIALVREQLTRMVEEATGRELKIMGAVKLAFYRKPSLVLEDVTLAGPPDAAGPELVRAERIAGEVNPLALLSGRTEIARLEIVRPTLTIRPEDRSLLDRVSRSQSGGIGLQADAIVFRQITITDGSVNYLVRQPNPSWRIDQASATFADTAGN